MRMCFDRAQIFEAAGGKIVHDDDLLPSLSRRSTRCDPMKPAPPVTSMCFVSLWFLIHFSAPRPLRELLPVFGAFNEFRLVRIR